MSDAYDFKVFQEKYNKEPVLYCKRCLSLAIMSEYDTDYCKECGCTDIGSTSIEHWQEMYEEKYHKKYIEDGKANMQ